MKTEVITEYDLNGHEIKRKSDGTFQQGTSGNPGGRLSRGQKIVRDFAISKLDQILDRLYAIGMDVREECRISPELQVHVLLKILERGAGKVQEAPVEEEDHGGDYTKMTGEQIMSKLVTTMKDLGYNTQDSTKGIN